MDDWRSCDNCSNADCPWDRVGDACFRWEPSPCPRCGGALSATREHNGRKYRHCFSCHGEFFTEDENG